jgi:hypothetical protein
MHFLRLAGGRSSKFCDVVSTVAPIPAFVCYLRLPFFLFVRTRVAGQKCIPSLLSTVYIKFSL